MIAFGAALVATAVGASLFRRRWLPLEDFGLALTADFLTASAMIIVGMQLIGLAGCFSFAGAGSVALAALGLGLLSRLSARRNQSRLTPLDGSEIKRPAGARSWLSRLERVTLSLLLALGLTAAGGTLARHWSAPVEIVTDGPIYHLWFVARWHESGRLDAIPTPFGERAAQWFPANGSLAMLWGVELARSDGPARLVQWPFQFVIAGLVGLLARRVSGRTEAGWLAGGAWLTVAPAVFLSGQPNVDHLFTAWWLAGILFALSAEGSSRAEPAIDPRLAAWLAGFGAGLAAGTKTIGIVFGPLLLLPLLIAAWRRGRFVAAFVRFLAASLLTGGFWYLRNLFETGNPLFPLELRVLSVPILQGWYDTTGMRNSSYHIERDRLDLGTAALARFFDARFLLLLVAGLLLAALVSLAGVLTKRRDSARPRGLGYLTFAAVVIVGLFWYVVPYNSQFRFLFPAVGLALSALVAIGGRFAGTRLALGAILIVLATTAPADFRPPPRGSWLPALGDTIMAAVGLRHAGEGADPMPRPALVSLERFQSAVESLVATKPTMTSQLAALLLALPAVSLALAWCLPGLTSSEPGPGTMPPAGPPKASLGTKVRARFAVGILGFVWLGIISWQGWTMAPFVAPAQGRGFYPAFGFGRQLLPGWLALDRLASERGSLRVAYAGTNLPWYLTGPGLRHSVRRIPVSGDSSFDLHASWLARRRSGDTTLSPDPHPDWDVERPDRERWLANLKAERIDVLFVARVNMHGVRHPPAEAPWPIERSWADADPACFGPLEPPIPPEGPEWVRVYRVIGP
jgi:hypothetical protein